METYNSSVSVPSLGHHRARDEEESIPVSLVQGTDYGYGYITTLKADKKHNRKEEFGGSDNQMNKKHTYS